MAGACRPGMAPASAAYEPRDPARQVLFEVVRDHFETFRAQAAALRDGEGLPRFVEREFREFLTCGCLAAGFARFRCDGCGHDRLVPFSCKGRGFCPSCGGRRMAERAAHLVDRVLPDVPMRQWVLSLPYRLRYLLAWDHDLCRAVVGVYVRAVLGFLRARARRAGIVNGRSGAVAILQRFGGSINLNLHIHLLAIDGVFAPDGETLPCERTGTASRPQQLPVPRAGEHALRFHPARRLTRDDVAEVVAVVAGRLERLLARRGMAAASGEQGASDRWAEEAPALVGLAAASVQGLVARGPRAGTRVSRYGAPPEEARAVRVGPCHATLGGFDLHAGLVVPAGDRERLERLCRYALRPPIAQARLRIDREGHVWITLRHPWADGTTDRRFDPLTLLERLAVLVPRPRINLLLYYGVLAPRAPWRAAVVASAGSAWSDVAAAISRPGAAGPGAAAGGSVGRIDAAHVRARRPGVSPVRRAIAPARRDRSRGRRGADPAASGAASRAP